MITRLTVTKVDSSYLCWLTSNAQQRICPVAGLERMATGSVAKCLTPLRHTSRITIFNIISSKYYHYNKYYILNEVKPW